VNKNMAYEHTNARDQKYFLHKRDVTLRGSGKHQVIYFFARKTGSGAIDELPAGYEVVENKRTGLPVLKKS
jgi:hypothetical protein